jgi:hypothetical protein
MGAAEIAYRVQQALHARLEQRGVGLARTAVPMEQFGTPWCAMQAAVRDVEPYRAAADRILAGRFDVFALHGVELGFPPRWNRDPKTGTEAPLTFGKTLNYRDEQVVGDIKYLWEPNRHMELVTLAQAWRLTGEMKYAVGCRSLLESWFEQCPYPLGPNWTSSLEHSVRLLNWSVAWQLLNAQPMVDHIGTDSVFPHPNPLPEGEGVFSGESGEAFRRRWLDSIYRHCHFIAGHFSKHSSANNHLFGEYMGLFIGALMWPCWKESARWLETARAGLESEALKQNAPDGVNREQAIWYQHEVADMMLLCGLAGKASGTGFSVAWWKRLEAMLEFIAALMDVGGKLPMIGDSDDAVMVRFSREPGFNAYRSLLATGAVLFERGDFARKAGCFDDKSRWLLGDEAVAVFESLIAPPSADGNPDEKHFFPDGGYCILGGGFNMPDEVRIVADAGPLGYLSIAAHGHADALAFTLSAGGQEILIDPGTYAYHTQKKWRDYFRGTSAHNTVRVDGEDQSVIGGNFMWLKHARAWCEKWETSPALDLFVGAHDGYSRLADPVIHRRSLEFDKPAGVIRIADTLTCKGPHKVEIHWHFAETCRVQVRGNEISAVCGNQSITMLMSGCEWLPVVKSGQEDPPMGWISRNFDQKCHSPSVVWSGQITGSTTLDTEIRLVRHES